MDYTTQRHGEFRQGRKYRKNRTHVKKSKDADPWREEKLRDHRRRHRYNWNKIPPIVKDITNAKMRQWTREQLAHERYDELSRDGQWERKSLFDLWAWT